jgi:WD40 repeat protein
MNNLPREKLCELIERYGPSLCEDPHRCEGLLRDLCVDHKREIFVLMSALRERVVADLLSLRDGMPRELLFGRLIKRLQENVAISEDAARWAVESWAIALGKLEPKELERLRTMVQLPSSALEKNSSVVPPTRYMPSMTPSGSLPQQIPDRKFPLVYIYIAAAVLIFMVLGTGAVLLLKSFAPAKKDTTKDNSSAEIKAIKPKVYTFHNEAIRSVALSPDGRFGLSGGYDRVGRLWDMETGQEIRNFEGHTKAIFCVGFSPDGRRALTAGEDTTVHVWDVQTGKEIRKFTEHKKEVLCAVFSPDSRRILSCGVDRTIRLWDVETGIELGKFSGHTKTISYVAFSPDGRRALSCSWDLTIRLWDLQNGTEIRTFLGQTKELTCVVFSPDGSLALSGGYDNTARLWDVESGREIRAFKGHRSAVLSVAFSPDGRRVITGSFDETARLWDTESGQELLGLNDHTQAVTSVLFSRDGKRAITGSFDETIRIWDLSK